MAFGGSSDIDLIWQPMEIDPTQNSVFMTSLSGSLDFQEALRLSLGPSHTFELLES